MPDIIVELLDGSWILAFDDEVVVYYSSDLMSIADIRRSIVCLVVQEFGFEAIELIHWHPGFLLMGLMELGVPKKNETVVIGSFGSDRIAQWRQFQDGVSID